MVSGFSPSTERGGGSTSRPPRSFTYTETFESLCPEYMAMGMSRDEFWNGDCMAAVDYRRAWKLRQEQYNRIAWLLGLYAYEAICDVSPILRPFSKARRPLPYPTEPYDLHMGESPVEAEQRERKEYESKKTKMEILAATWNAQFAKRKKAKSDG